MAQRIGFKDMAKRNNKWSKTLLDWYSLARQGKKRKFYEKVGFAA